MRHHTNGLPEGIYGITAEKYSKGRSNVDVVTAMIKGGVKIIQYREKHAHKSFKNIYEECLAIRKITRHYGIPFIVNDYIDIALMVEADGVHIGQDDIPIAAVRKLKKDMLIGISTHEPAQALKAVQEGADYIGVGPIFLTQTKEDVCDPVGLTYLDYVVSHITIPFVAIGGIKKDTVKKVARRGAKTICLVTEIVGADHIEKRVKEIEEEIK